MRNFLISTLIILFFCSSAYGLPGEFREIGGQKFKIYGLNYACLGATGEMVQNAFVRLNGKSGKIRRLSAKAIKRRLVRARSELSTLAQVQRSAKLKARRATLRRLVKILKKGPGDCRSVNFEEDNHNFPAPNTLPSAHAGADQFVEEGTLVTLDGTGSSDLETPAGELSYSWTQEPSRAQAVTVSDPHSARATFSVSGLAVAQVFVFRLTVRDKGSPALESSDLVEVHVRPHSAARAQISATRSTCVAPCAVFFDAIGDLSWQQVEEHQFDWDFGQGTEGDVSSGGRYFRGYMAGHVFELPDDSPDVDYSVTLTVSQNGAFVSQSSIIIRVSPFRGRTLCVSQENDFGGCPSLNSADHVSSIDLTSVPENIRLLFRRGESWTYENTGAILRNVLMGSYGNRQLARPRLHSFNREVGEFLYLSDSVISDLHISGDANGNSANFLVYASSNSLVLRTEIGPVNCHHKGFGAGGSNNLIVDSHVHDVTGNGGCYGEAYGMYFGGEKNGVIGTLVEETQRTSLRTYANRVLVANSYFRNPRTNPTLRFYPERWGLVTGNTSETDGMPHYGIGHNCCSADKFQPENVIVEKNKFIGSYVAPLSVGGKNIAIRNNVAIDMPNLVQLHYDQDAQGAYIETENVAIYNNTIYSAALRSLVGTASEDYYSNIRIHNNICRSPVKDAWPRLVENYVVSGGLQLDDLQESHNLFSFPMAESGHQMFSVGGLKYDLPGWQLTGQGQGTGSFGADVFGNAPKFSELMSFSEREFPVTVSEGASGTELTSPEIDFEALRVIPGISNLFIISSPGGYGAFDCDSNGEPDTGFQSCRYMKAASVSGHTVVMPKDILHAGPVSASVNIWYSPSSAEKIYTYYPDSFSVGDSLTYYDSRFMDSGQHTVVSKGTDLHGSFVVVSPALFNFARTSGVLMNWGDAVSRTLDLSPLPASAAVDSGKAVPVWEDASGRPRPYGSGFDIGAFESRD